MRKTYRSKWFEFTPGFHGFDMRFCLAGYFDERPMLDICLGWGHLFLKLPFRTGINQCSTPEYGVYYFDTAVWFCWGMKKYAWYMPWKWAWVRTSYLMVFGDWIHETKKDRHKFNTKFNSICADFEHKKWKEVYRYKYVLKNGTIQDVWATVGVEEREWRWHWFKWLPFPRKISKDIAVQFSEEVGEKTGSWKGGCVGCGYQMLPGEAPVDTLRRMERERKF